jgi:hypothetical protein
MPIETNITAIIGVEYVLMPCTIAATIVYQQTWRRRRYPRWDARCVEAAMPTAQPARATLRAR